MGANVRVDVMGSRKLEFCCEKRLCQYTMLNGNLSIAFKGRIIGFL